MSSTENISTEIEATGIKVIACIGEIAPIKSMKYFKKPIGATGIEAKAILSLYSSTISEAYNWGKGAYIKRGGYCPYLYFASILSSSW